MTWIWTNRKIFKGGKIAKRCYAQWPPVTPSGRLELSQAGNFQGTPLLWNKLMDIGKTLLFGKRILWFFLILKCSWWNPKIFPHALPVKFAVNNQGISEQDKNLKLFPHLRQEWRPLQLESGKLIIGAPQPSFLSPIVISSKWHLIVIDLQNCFFTILLHPEDHLSLLFPPPLKSD